MMRMGRVITIVNEKGGVGKSTTSWNLALALSELGRKTLLIDADPLSGLKARIEGRKIVMGLLDCLIEGNEPQDCLKEFSPMLDILYGSLDLVEFEVKGFTGTDKEQCLKGVVDKIKNGYDYVVIDTPSSLGMITVNALVASDQVVIPVCCDYFAMDGISSVVCLISDIAKRCNTNLRLNHFLITRYDSTLRSSSRVLDEIRTKYQGLLFNTVIPESHELKNEYRKVARELFLDDQS